MEKNNLLADAILEERERRNQQILTLCKKNCVITLKANIPGLDKNIKEAFFLIQLFEKELDRILLNVTSKQIIYGVDGPMVQYILSVKSFDHHMTTIYKQKMIELEENLPLGRFVDIDVYDDETSSRRRTVHRKCVICGDDVYLCNRSLRHSYQELIVVIQIEIRKYLYKTITDFIEKSILAELELDPKFGLVTPVSSGTHSDMDYELMKKSMNVLIEPLWQMFDEGFSNFNLDDIFKNIRKIGAYAERKMLEVTNGINTYKGLIFCLGIALSASGYILQTHSKFDDIFVCIKKMCQSLKEELDSMILQDAEKQTFGVMAYKNYGIRGARMEACSGFRTIQSILLEVTDLSKKSLTMTLIKLIQMSDDTVFLKRAGSIENYYYFKELFKKIKIYNEDDVYSLTKLCIKNNLSFGGSADLLIVTIYFYLFRKKFF